MRKSVRTDLETLRRQGPQFSMAQGRASEVRANWNIESTGDILRLEYINEPQIVSFPVVPTRRYDSWCFHIIVWRSTLRLSNWAETDCSMFCEILLANAYSRVHSCLGEVPANQAESETHQEIEWDGLFGILERRLYKTT